ncbi:P22-like injection translocase [Pseudomonas phage AH02]|nr:P22-like injection translocase [Pseudomonas phage AH02]
MANNPFYVDPGNDYSPALSGLSSTFKNIRQERILGAEEKRRQQQEERQQLATDAAQQAYKSGDPDQMAQVSLQYPEIAQNLHQVVGLNDERKVKEAAGFARTLLTSPPEQRDAIFQNRIKTLQDQGRDPSHTVQAYQQYQSNPDAAIQGITLDWAAGDPQGYGVIADQRKAEAAAARDTRKEAREDRKLDQQLSIAQMSAADRSLTRQIAALTAQQGATMNDLKRQELAMKIDSTKEKAEQNKVEMKSKATSEVASFDDTLSLINSIEQAPGLEGNFGKSSYIPNIRGSDAANAKSLIDQLGGKAFLEAYNSLRGGGSITETEGKEAKTALLNMQGAQSAESFRKNLATFKSVIERGRTSSIKKQAKYLGDQDSSSANTAPSSGGWEIIQ